MSFSVVQGNRKKLKQKKFPPIDIVAEGHVSHILSLWMSSRPMGWSREGADSLSRLRISWKSGGDMLELVRGSKETGSEKPPEEASCLSVAELLSWERKHR